MKNLQSYGVIWRVGGGMSYPSHAAQNPLEVHPASGWCFCPCTLRKWSRVNCFGKESIIVSGRLNTSLSWDWVALTIEKAKEPIGRAGQISTQVLVELLTVCCLTLLMYLFLHLSKQGPWWFLPFLTFDAKMSPHKNLFLTLVVIKLSLLIDIPVEQSSLKTCEVIPRFSRMTSHWVKGRQERTLCFWGWVWWEPPVRGR